MGGGGCEEGGGISVILWKHEDEWFSTISRDVEGYQCWHGTPELHCACSVISFNSHACVVATVSILGRESYDTHMMFLKGLKCTTLNQNDRQPN